MGSDSCESGRLEAALQSAFVDCAELFIAQWMLELLVGESGKFVDRKGSVHERGSGVLAELAFYHGVCVVVVNGFKVFRFHAIPAEGAMALGGHSYIAH